MFLDHKLIQLQNHAVLKIQCSPDDLCFLMVLRFHEGEIKHAGEIYNSQMLRIKTLGCSKMHLESPKDLT